MPTDLYGLRLSTTAGAAAAYNAALRKILLVQSGAEEDLRAAVRADPGFALAHAALALLGHGYGARVDVPRALATATAGATRAGTDRERGHVATVAAYLRGRPAAVPAYLRAYPRDALLLSAAVPTIAFAGVTSVPQQAWALVESLAPAYGADWWYAGMLAFVRQEQERWDEAMALCERALAAEPASGHAVHARAHVHYETGDHGAGLSWLDGWLDRLGPRAHHGAHFSWHAALHELALHDAAAVRRRYHRQLAPPRVTGMRALVDSASLLWRCELTGAWDGPVPIGAALDAVDPLVLARPGTPFAAWHAAVALAAAGDAAGLARLARYAGNGPTEVFTAVVAPLADGLRAYVEGRHDDAATALLSIRPRLTALGGSKAQREVIEQTLLHALLGAGRLDEARTLLARLLDRQPLAV
jgi:tetratricopeptide (TPR) repeat protein